MHDEHVALDGLIGAWRAAFESAQAALGAASRDGDLTAGEGQLRSRRLHEERASTVELLGHLAREIHAPRPGLVRLLASPREAKQLLGLPPQVTACVFNVDGVLVASAAIHAEAWKRALDEFVFHWIDLTGTTTPTFSRRRDYPTLIHGHSREAAVRSFLASRGITIAEGAPEDPPGTTSVHAVANAKHAILHDIIAREGVSAYAGARLYLQLARDAHLRTAVVSGSTNTRALLDSAQLMGLIDDVVDGNAALERGLGRKPAPDMLLDACRRLSVEPSCAAVFETTADGVAAGRAGGFALILAIEQDGDARALRAREADVVVRDLGQLLERALGG